MYMCKVNNDIFVHMYMCLVGFQRLNDNELDQKGLKPVLGKF